MHASLASADRAVVLVRLDTAGAVVTHAAARHLLPLSILHDRVHHVLISTHAWRVLGSQVDQIRLHTKQFCTNAMYPTATTTTSPLPLPLSPWHTLLERSHFHNQTPEFSKGCIIPHVQRSDIRRSQTTTITTSNFLLLNYLIFYSNHRLPSTS